MLIGYIDKQRSASKSSKSTILSKFPFSLGFLLIHIYFHFDLWYFSKFTLFPFYWDYFRSLRIVNCSIRGFSLSIDIITSHHWPHQQSEILWYFFFPTAIGGSTSPCSDIFAGVGAFSEAESQAVRNFLMSGINFASYLTVHSYGQMWLYPWGYTSALPSDWQLLVSSLKQIAFICTLSY